MLGTGDRVPGDLLMIEVNNLACREAALTGESVPIDEVTSAISPNDGSTPQQIPLGDWKSMCFSATLVEQGAGVGIVVATGDKMEIGTSLVEEKKTAVLEQIDYV